MTSRELEAVCRVWQMRMRLRDWNISVCFVSAKKMPEPEKWADIEYNRADQNATVRILRASDMQRRHGRVDVEGSLVHELGHLIMPDLTEENKEQIEAAIDRWAEIVTAAYDS